MAKGIYKRKKSKFYWICYRGLDGRVMRESSGSTRYSEADGLLTKRKRERDEGKEPEIKKIANHTFQELAEQYLLWINGRQLSAGNSKYIVNQLVSKYRNRQLRSFDTMTVEQLQTDSINRGLKNASNNKILNILRRMLSKAVDWEMLTEDTLKRARKVKLLPEDRRLRFISTEECRELIDACEPHLQPIVVTALSTGCRKSEVLKLEWDKHVDLKHGFITLDKTKNGERREIPINETLRSTLTGLTRRVDIPYVFHSQETGKRYLDIKRSFSTALRRSKIRDFHFHDLRHTFASHLVMAGVDLTTVSRLLGHKDIKMTLRYAHLAPSHMRKAVDVLDNTLTGKTSTSHFTSHLGV